MHGMLATLNQLDITIVEFLTILALALNFMGLIFAGYQAILARRSFESAKESIDHSRRSRHLEHLPQAGWIIQVQVSLDRWCDELQAVIGPLEEAVRKKDGTILKEIATNTHESSKGLVNRFVYEHAPPPLVEILMSGARHFFNAFAPMQSLWNVEKDEPQFGLAESLLSRCRESSEHILGLLDALKDLLPEAYLESPARLRDEDYLTC